MAHDTPIKHSKLNSRVHTLPIYRVTNVGFWKALLKNLYTVTLHNRKYIFTKKYLIEGGSNPRSSCGKITDFEDNIIIVLIQNCFIFSKQVWDLMILALTCTKCCLFAEKYHFFNVFWVSWWWSFYHFVFTNNTFFSLILEDRKSFAADTEFEKKYLWKISIESTIYNIAITW